MAGMEYRELGKTGMKISIIGYGASPLGGVFDPADEGEGVKAVHYAIDHGINYFDVAPMYGVTLAETRLGKALKGKRDKIFLATKCCRYDVDKFDFSYDRVIKSIDESLQRLQTDYVDVFQVHDVEFGDKSQVLNEAIPAALKVKEMGKARNVGITGLPVRYLAMLAREAPIDTVLSWAHYNLLEDELNDELVPLSKEKGFGLMSSAPLLQRILSDSRIPDWHRSPQPVKDMQPKLLEVCKKYGVNLGDVANRYALDHPDVATTIVGMSKMRSIERNVRVLDFKMPEGILEEIEKLVAPVKNMMWFEGKPENDIPRK
jgi:L-galactose dehydrogenase